MSLGIENLDLNLSKEEAADLRNRGLLGLGYVATGMRGSRGPSVPVGDRQKVHDSLKKTFEKSRVDQIEIVEE